VLARLKTHLTLQNLQSTLTQQNAQLQEEIAEREKLIAELNAFAHTVAHDLKNPLGVIATYAQFLQKFFDKLPPPELEQRLEVIVRNSQKMNTIITELLLLATVRTEEFMPEPLEMAEIVDETLARLEMLITESQTEIIILEPESWPVVIGYGPWVEEIWANYISNAIKYGGRPPRVELGAASTPGGQPRFWVRDNGPGLTRAEQARLFIPFSRLDQTEVEGHGLGLSIVQRIVDKLGGAVSVESKGVPGLGCVFSFTLPQNSPDESAPPAD
jgi:signal transduction histidine kinase